jgi:CHAT domain-containing protein/tetratricopeptide (TPR) repeat protein
MDVTRLLALLALGMAVPSATAGAQDARGVVQAVKRAVEADTALRARTRFRQRLARNPHDREALLGLGTLLRLTYDYPASDSLYRRLVAGPVDGFTVYARFGTAEGLEARSYGRAATTTLSHALRDARAINDRTAEGEILLWLAFARGRLEGVAVAEATLDSASRLIPASAFDLRSRLWSRRAITHALRGRTREASLAADSAIGFARRARDGRAEGDAFRALGQVLQYRGQWDSALVALHQSEQVYRRSRNRSALASSLIWHAQVVGSLGRYGEMREIMRRALVEGEATNNPGVVGDAHRAFGVLAIMLRDWPAAAAHLNRSRTISATTGDSSALLTISKYLVQVAINAGDLATAKRMTQEQLAWALRTEDAVSQYNAHQAMADLAARDRDWPAVERSLDAVRAQLRHLPGDNYRMQLVHQEARLALLRGDLAHAERMLRMAIGPGEGDKYDNTLFDLRVRLAYIHARRGKLADAERELRTATDHLERWRARLNDGELRTLAFQQVSSAVNGAGEPTTAARAAHILAALARGGQDAAAFALAERWRARELSDQLARSAALREGPPSSPASPSLASASVPTAADVAAALPDDSTALIEFVAAEGAPITAFVVQRGGVAARVLPAVDSLESAVARFTALMESGADATRLARQLGSRLLEPVLPLLGPRVTRLVVVPDGPLHRLPFDALRLADGRYLIERYAFGTAPSASVVTALWTREPRRPPARDVRLLAFGDPATPRATPGAPRGVDSGDVPPAFHSTDGLPRLTGAAREARRVARYATQAEVRLGRDASAAFLKRTDLRNYRVLHFAAHAIIDERSVAGTALALAPGNGESGFVGAGDLAALQLDADLVVLSACSAARGVLVGGEGLQGLTSPLLQAGARALVATEWRIRDRDVVDFVDAFYAELARGRAVADALRGAKLRAIRRGDPLRTWAAFTAIGDPLVVVPLRAPRDSWWTGLARVLRSDRRGA